MEDNIDDILDSISDNFFSQYPNINNTNPSRTTTNNTNRNNRNNMTQQSNVNPSPSMRYVNRQLDTIYESMLNYNTNMLQYHANIREMLRLINVNSMNYRSRINENRQSHDNRNTPNIPRPPFNNTRQRENGNNSFFFSQWTQPLFNQSISPTLSQAQIQQNTSTFTYSEQSQEHVRETRCPISLENFQNGDSLCQIIGCGHVFLHTNLMSWFSRSHQCPICRYDVMNNRPQENNQTTENNQTNPNTQNNNIQQNLEQEMYNLMQTFIDSTITGLNTNYDISINTIPLTSSYTFTDASQPIINTTTVDVSNNDSDDEIEPDLSVD